MQLIYRIESAYWGRRNASNDATWANSDPGGLKLLMWAEGITKNG